MYDPPSPLCFCWVGVRCLGVRFCAGSDRGGWVFGLLLPVGGVFGFRCVTPPPPCGVVCCMRTLLGGAFFFRNGPCFWLESFLDGVDSGSFLWMALHFEADAMTTLPYFIICEFKVYENGFQWFWPWGSLVSVGAEKPFSRYIVCSFRIILQLK